MMKRALMFVGIPLVVVVVLFLLLLDEGTDGTTLILDDSSQVPPASDGSPSAVDDLTDVSADGLGSYPAPPANARPAAIERLADGDSFDIQWLDTGESDEVRLFGINAPELAACFGDAAKGVLQEITEDQELLIEPIDRDDFGRTLGNLWAGDVLVNVRIVELGAALALSDGSDHTPEIQQAQLFASANKLGVWDPAFCGASDDVQVFIDQIHADAPGQDHLNPNGEWIELVNLGETRADLTNWSIRDESTRHRYYFPDGFALAAGDSVQVFSGCGDDAANALYWCDGDSVWNNGGDTGFLVDPDGRFADSLSYSG